MKPILFNTEMVTAIQDGRKTMTRRLAAINTDITCNNGTTNHDFVLDNFNPCYRPTGFVCRKCGFGVAPPHSRVPVGTSMFRPRYWPGDILYVRETWCEGKVAYGEEPDGRCVPFISQCLGEDDIIPKEWAMREGIGIEDVVWRPSIHMPKAAARIFLLVKRVSVERLHDIAPDQCAAEGIELFRGPAGAREAYYVSSFAALWDTTIPPADLPEYGWDANPWVWVIEFERCEKPKEAPHGK